MHVTGKERMATERKKAHIVMFDNLAPLAYVLPLNFHFPSVQSVLVYSLVFCTPFGLSIRKHREWLRTMTLMSCAGLSCSR